MICEGRLANSDSVNLGSNPSSPAIDIADIFDVLCENRFGFRHYRSALLDTFIHELF